jgi:hypothetical protein
MAKIHLCWPHLYSLREQAHRYTYFFSNNVRLLIIIWGSAFLYIIKKNNDNNTSLLLWFSCMCVYVRLPSHSRKIYVIFYVYIYLIYNIYIILYIICNILSGSYISFIYDLFHLELRKTTVAMVASMIFSFFICNQTYNVYKPRIVWEIVGYVNIDQKRQNKGNLITTLSVMSCPKAELCPTWNFLLNHC